MTYYKYPSVDSAISNQRLHPLTFEFFALKAITYALRIIALKLIVKAFLHTY